MRIDPLEPADAIYVLGGSRASRALEAADLYHAGLAPRIVLSAGRAERAELVLAQRGIHVPTDEEMMRGILVNQLGVPESAVQLLPNRVDNTAEEATLIAGLARTAGWRRVIVLTMCAATRRAGIAFHRVLGNDVAVTIRCPRHDSYDGRRWWTSRASIRDTIGEMPKLIAY